VAPVATAVTYAKENGFVLGFGVVKGFLAKGIPIYGVVGMLKKIGAFFFN